jgi:hypothetical protein
LSINPIDQTPVRISTNISVARQTPKTDFGDRMKQGLDSSAGIDQHNTIHPSPVAP